MQEEEPEPHNDDCKACYNANTIYNQVKLQEAINFFLICEQGHALCQACYGTHIQKTTGKIKCPFGKQGQDILRVDIPIKALRLQNSSAIKNCADHYIQLHHENQLAQNEIRKGTNDGNRDPPFLIRREMTTLQVLKSQKATLTKELAIWQQRTAFRHLSLYLFVDIILMLVQMASSIFQFYIMIWSIRTDYQQVTSICFYFISFYIGIIVVYYKTIFEIKELSEITCTTIVSAIIKCVTVFPIFFYYLVFLVTYISRGRRKRHQKRNEHGCTFQNGLSFQKINFCILMGKVVVFLQYFTRLYDMSNFFRLNQAVLVFSLLQILALFACDGLHLFLIKNDKSS